MDRFLLKRSHPSSVSSSAERSVTPLPSKRPSPAAKQDNVSALVQVAEFGSDKFYADGWKLSCKACNVVIELTRKNTVERHLKRKVRLQFELLGVGGVGP